MEENNKTPQPPQNLPNDGNAPEFLDNKPPKDDFVDLSEHSHKILPQVDIKVPIKKDVVTKINNFVAPQKTAEEVVPTKEDVKNKNDAVIANPVNNTKPNEQKQQETTPVDTTPEKPKMKPDEKSFSTLRTYEDDIARVLRGSRASVSSIRSAEIKKKEIERKNIATGKTNESKYELPNKPRSVINWSKVFIGLLILLFILGGSVVLVSFWPSSEIETVAVAVSGDDLKPESFFLVEKSVEIPTDDGTKSIFFGKLKELRGSTLGQLGTATQFYFTKKVSDAKTILNFTNFLDLFSITAPSILTRNISSDFVFGMHVYDGNQPFIVLKSNSYGNSFAGMLEWEKTLEKDMKGILILNNPSIEGTATTTADLLKKHPFKDKVILNRDTRVMLDDNGELMMLYSFINSETIVMTTNEGTLKDIIGRVERIQFTR
ncbi:hypothetical protein COW81_00795 [Candidatus Campbellbacteria bacterium CG22_combo_CG10-13_8_21_14_all_36_13]|uniref:Uncharacterized protein n=1 Tax=Candidatus Campbellbacteria bacterium CG22_combo_CG10-13_8_21_14_all_36_13 TaxID=1974529 RepID=A0A2H0DYU2_9BACT|nr:MAG: hypothetical protein COW81_00795 [Candidatus Campbellbacteria bacterium CG22_combo_CG10-13_8_21_14_all_36_13]